MFGKNPEYKTESLKILGAQTEFKNSILNWSETYENEKKILARQQEAGSKQKKSNAKHAKKYKKSNIVK
jgi:hypothetical protein